LGDIYFYVFIFMYLCILKYLIYLAFFTKLKFYHILFVKKSNMRALLEQVNTNKVAQDIRTDCTL